MASQSIRPSQFITTFGPGSILEGPGGPRIVYDLARSNIFSGQQISDFAIRDAGLSQVLGSGAQIVRLPTNADLGVADYEAIYQTEYFPKWSLCVARAHAANILYRWRPHNENRTGCPRCAPLSDSYAAWAQSRREAIRFVQACPAGHLDDVNWIRLIRHRQENCAPDHLLWRGGGGSLSNVEIECPVCGASANLGQKYGSDLWCSGVFAERGQLSGQARADAPRCDRSAQMMQRGAAQLYQATHLTAITIPSLDTELHQLMASSQVIRALRALNRFRSGPLTEQDIRQAISPPEEPDERAERMLGRYDGSVIVRTAEEVLSHEFPSDEEGLRQNEFRQLQRAATHGHPTQASSTRGAPPLFEVLRSDVREDIIWGNSTRLRLTPVSRLRAVMVQTGYSRPVGTTIPSIVSVEYQVGVDRWFPGVELYGEGLFLDLVPEPGQNGITRHPPMPSATTEAWMQSYGTNDYKYHPVFVWWHTLAHRLISALSIDSGYSSSAIRERIYIRINEDDGSASGGILLYTVQPGGDGTLGGLLALAPQFERVLAGALDRVDSCSNDPLCGEEEYAEGRHNGAVCYACGLLSETSCEHRNMNLDRNLLRRHLP